MKKLIFAAPVGTQELSSKNTYLGIITPFERPYNVFMNLSQIQDPNQRFVYIFAYILGAKRIAMWAVYDKDRDRFMIDGSCRYHPNQLSSMVNTWSSRDTVYVANSVKDRFTEKINFYLDQKGIQYPDYVRNKYILGYLDNLISEEELNERYPNAYQNFLNEFENQTGISELSPDYDYQLQEYIEDLREANRKYETTINRLDLDRYNLPRVDLNTQREVGRITQKFYTTVQYGTFETDKYYNSLMACPDLQQCQRNLDEGCKIYYYGDESLGLLSEEDPRSLL